ncbi:nickase, partial [Geobacillus stearothermophilus]
GESSKDFEADLHRIHVSEQQKLERMPKPETEAQIMEYQYRQHVADGLLEAIEEAQRANDRKKYEKDPTKKRQRRRYRGQEFER